MKKHILYHYKAYDGTYLNETDRKVMETFNDYGYNLNSNMKRDVTSMTKVGFSGPHCLKDSFKKQKE